MATEIVPPGLSSMSTIFAADGNTVKFMGGEQELTDCDKSARTMASIQIAKESRVWNQAANPLKIDVTSTTNQVDQITFNAAATGGNITLTIQKPDGTFANTANSAWNATDATFLSNLNTQLDAASGVVGGIVATAIPSTDTDLGIRLTYSGTGYAGKAWTPAVVLSFFTSTTTATYTRITDSARAAFVDRSAGSRSFHLQAGGPATKINIAKFLGSRGGSLLGGDFLEYHQRAGEGFANASTKLYAVYIFGGTYRVDFKSDLMTDGILKACTFNSQRGFTGTFEIHPGTKAMFKRADVSGGSVQAGGILKIEGGDCDWALGTIAELHWKGDGEFSLRNAGINLTITKLYISSANKKKLLEQLKSANCTVTLPTIPGYNLFVYGDESDDLTS